MTDCSFCDSEIPKGKGIVYAKKDGTTFFFCTSKCRNNQLGLKRVGKKAAWVKRAKDAASTKKAKAKEGKAPPPKEEKKEVPKPEEKPKKEGPKKK